MSLWVWCVFRIHVFVLSTFPSFYTPWPFLCHGLQKKPQPFALINRNCDLKFFVFANQYDLIREKKNNVTVLTYRVVRCSESVEFRKGNAIKRSYINDLHLINIPVERESNYSKNQGNYRRSVTLSVFFILWLLRKHRFIFCNWYNAFSTLAYLFRYREDRYIHLFDQDESLEGSRCNFRTSQC